MTRRRRAVAVVAACVAAWSAASCGDGASGGTADADAAVTVDSSDLFVADSATIQTGPLLSGSLEPREEATVRAEVGGTVRRVRVEPGDSVYRGETLLLIDADAPTRDLESARAARRSAENQVDVAQRNVERMEHLVDVGAVAERELEDARNALTGAQAQLAQARAALTRAEKQVSDTRPEAPFDGVVSRRPVNAGDVVSPGTALATLIDPTSLRLVASVPTEALAAVRVGAPVEFTVTGYPERTFRGAVERINPQADPATRQVTLYVKLPNPDRDLVAGVYAEGRVTSQSRDALVVPVSATDVTVEEASTGPILRVRQGRVEKVDAAFGVVDEAEGWIQVQAGLRVGDTVLVGAAREITPGTPVRTAQADGPAARTAADGAAADGAAGELEAPSGGDSTAVPADDTRAAGPGGR